MEGTAETADTRSIKFELLSLLFCCHLRMDRLGYLWQNIIVIYFCGIVKREDSFVDLEWYEVIKLIT